MGLSKSAGAVVGENLARIRAERGQTQREASAFLRERGLAWPPGNIGQLESGKRHSVRIEELLMLSAAYEVKLWEWFKGESSVYLTDDLRIPREHLRLALRAKPFGLLYGINQVSTRYVTDEPERAAGLQLMMSLEEIQAAAERLWGHSMGEERDRRLGDTSAIQSPRSLQAKRGHATRTLIAELKEHLGLGRPTEETGKA